MKYKFKIIVIFLSSVIISTATYSIVDFSTLSTASAHECATCTGSTNCRACKNCRYCKHCARNGNACGVCR